MNTQLQMNQNKLEIPMLNENNMLRWLSKIEGFFRGNHYSEAQKLEMGSRYLAEPALSWYNWEVSQQSFASWEEFKDALMLWYCDVHSLQIYGVGREGTDSMPCGFAAKRTDIIADSDNSLVQVENHKDTEQAPVIVKPEQTPQPQEADSKETVTVVSVSTTTESELENLVALHVTNVPEETPESQKIGEDDYASVVVKLTQELPVLQKEIPFYLEAHDMFDEMPLRRTKEQRWQVLLEKLRKRVKVSVWFKKIKVKQKWKSNSELPEERHWRNHLYLLDRYYISQSHNRPDQPILKESHGEKEKELSARLHMVTSRGRDMVDCITEHSEPSLKSNWQTDGPIITELERAVLSLLEFGQVTAAKQLPLKLAPGNLPSELIILDAVMKLAMISTPCRQVPVSMWDGEVRSVIQSQYLKIDQPMVEPLQVLKNLSNILNEGSGRGLAREIIAVIKAANILVLTFTEAYQKQIKWNANFERMVKIVGADLVTCLLKRTEMLDVFEYQNLQMQKKQDLCEVKHELYANYSDDGRQALEWRVSMAKRFIEDWEWRLSVMQHLLPLSERHWGLKDVLSVLRVAPAKLLNLCMQRAKYDIVEQAVHRFALSAEDKATLELAEWVDKAFKRTLVEDVMSRTAEGASAVQDLDFSSLGSQLTPLAMILLCIDAAASSAKSPTISKQLLDKSQVMLSEIYPGGSTKVGFTYWDQVHEVAIIYVPRRIYVHDSPQILQASFSGDTIILSCTESHRQGQKDRVLAMLHQMIEDAYRSKRQFLSGKLHNLARVIADEKPDVDILKVDCSYMVIEKRIRRVTLFKSI